MRRAGATLSPAMYACPACRADLASAAAAVCPGCGRSYPATAGIPDLRLEQVDPSGVWGDDERAAEKLQARSPDLDFEGLLREHWRIAGKPPKLVERFVTGDMVAPDRAEAYLRSVETALNRRLTPDDRVLEIGAGTAALALRAAWRGSLVVASDVSPRWLVLARKRVEDAGAQIELVCCAAEALPFRDDCFDVVLAGDVIEHLADQRGFARECARVLTPGGMLFLATPNRYSLGLEPHVRLWGVGWLPRRFARRYVERVRRTGYDHVRLLSSFALRRMLEAERFRVTIEPPEVPLASQRLSRGIELQLVRLYNRLRLVAAVRRALLAIGPFFHVFAVKDRAT